VDAPEVQSPSLAASPIDGTAVPADTLTYAYDAFATYATDPDRDLVRAVEVFVEGFHRRPGLPERLHRQLELCVDGRDFRVPRREGKADPEAIAGIVEIYQRQSRALVVFCGPRSRGHPWIEKEVRWWLKHREGAPIYVALSHGAPPDIAGAMPPVLVERGGGDAPDLLRSA